MFFRWLLTTFPLEMRGGWALVRPDLMLWVGLASLVAVARLTLPVGASEPPPAIPFLITLVSNLAIAMLPAILFTAQVEGRQLTWGPVLLLVARKTAPLVVYALVAIAIAWVAETAMILAFSAALGDSPLLIPASTMAGVIIFVSILVRYSYLPFLVILFERDKLPAGLWQWQRAGAIAPLFWPLTASARLTEGSRWRLVFYTLLGPVLPVLASYVPAVFVLPASILALLLLLVVQAVFFAHFRRRCEEGGIALPPLPLEAVQTA